MSHYILEIDTSINNNTTNSVTVELVDSTTVDVINNTTIFVSDLPEGYPLDWTTGTLPISRVSGLDIVAGSGIDVLDNSGIYTISLLNPTIYTSGIVDFTESVQDIIGNSGLFGGSYIQINYNDTTGLTTISTTGLQPSGNYSVVGHTHTSSNITDFSSSVSGLLPVKNISAGSGIGITSLSGNYTVSVTGTFGLTSEEVDDRVNSLLKSGNYINLNYNDNLNELTISVTGLQPSGNYSVVGHSHIITDISGLQTALDNKQPSGVYASGVHYHLSTDISDFNSAVSGLIPPSNFTSLTGLSGITVSNSGTDYYVSLNDPTIQLVDITDLSSNARNFLLTPSSNNLQTLVSDETGSGIVVFNDSPVFSGIPTVPTAPSGTNSNQIASTAFVRTEISNLVDSSPSTLDTLNELAAALGDDPNFATTITNSLANKANLSGAIFTGPVTIPSGTGNFNSLSVNGTGVSISGHTHSYTDIINFASGIDQEVSTLLVAGSYINLNYDNMADTLTISTSGLQPSGNYSIVGHTHTSSNITDFNSSVSGLLPSISNSGNNRLLTSTGSSVGINAESNLTFDGSILDVSGQINIDDITLNTNIISTNTTNTDLILKPNGNGSLLADASGNARGIYSNDFQRERTSVSGVAAGGYSVICGGSDNRASHSYSVVCGGQTNAAANSLATVGGGDLNTANGNRSTICGGGSNIASGASSNIAGGSSNQSTGPYSIIPGGFRAKATRHGELSHGAGFFVNPGDAQHTVLIARRNTTDATADVVLTLNGLAPASTNILNIPAQTMWTFSIKISAYNNTNSEGAWWIIRGGIRRNNSNATTLVGSLIIESGADSSMSAASATAVADDTNEALEIRVTGIAGKSIRWVAVIDISQVSFGVI